MRGSCLPPSIDPVHRVIPSSQLSTSVYQAYQPDPYLYALCITFLLSLCMFAGGALPNDQFWSEWADLRALFSLELCDLFNRIFVLVPSLRCSLQDMLRHPWVASGTRLTPEEIRTQMEAR